MFNISSTNTSWMDDCQTKSNN
uniref:Uncharacterized protein n=1 Tax=Rhizophora mucronata TaxID=61149 RepID=A0A2P2PHS8_RHIMU